MAFGDLREYIAAIEKSGDLLRVKKEVDWDMELGAISRQLRAVRSGALV